MPGRFAIPVRPAITRVKQAIAEIRMYPQKTAGRVLAGLVASTPGDEGGVWRTQPSPYQALLPP